MFSRFYFNWMKFYLNNVLLLDYTLTYNEPTFHIVVDPYKVRCNDCSVISM